MPKIIFEPKDALFLFEWQVDQDGYELAERPQDDGTTITIIQCKGGPVRGYRLDLEEKDAGLFRQFASLDRTPEAVVEFATEYGLLWQEYGDLEPIKAWFTAIGTMQALVGALEEGRHEAFWALFNDHEFRPRFSAWIEPNRLLPPKSKFKLMPDSLMAVMWLQLADYSTKGTAFKQCEFCPRWFPVGPGTGRKASKRFCSARCRVAWNRRHNTGGHHAR